MSTFDDESQILETFSLLKHKDIFFIGRHLPCEKVYLSLKYLSLFKHWKDSSKANDPPPDFYNEKSKLMMDVMRFDDCSFIDEHGNVQNPIYKKEAQVMKKLFGYNYKKDAKHITCFLSVKSGLPPEKDHNFDRYRSNFMRTFEKHNSSIPLYKKNHPGYRTILYLFDESTLYVEAENRSFLNCKAGDPCKGKIHYPFLDRQFLNIIENSKADFIVWHMPWKFIIGINGKEIKVPRCAIIDCKRIKNKRIRYYDYNLITSIEKESKNRNHLQQKTK